MTSTVTITAHPALASDGTPLVVEVLEFNEELDRVKETYLKNGETYSCAVWEGRSVSIEEIKDDRS
jgi:hypothetical protein